MTNRWNDLVLALRGRRYRRGIVDASTPWHEIAFADGLADDEIERIEERFGFQFPDDLRELLRTALPVGDGFPDWRHGNMDAIAHRLAWPKDGLLADVEHGWWWPDWGPRPADLAAALALAATAIDAAPRLVPVFGHRMMPVEPGDAGNPVLSVHQSDIIVYGSDLEDYLLREFVDPTRTVAKPSRSIRFWSQLVETN